MSYYVYMRCCNDVQILKVQKGKGVCSTLVALFLWQQVTHLAAVMHTVVFHPVDMGVYQNWVCFLILCDSV